MEVLELRRQSKTGETKMKRFIFGKKDMRKHLIAYVKELEDLGVPEEEIQERLGRYYTNGLIRKYSNEEQDEHWNYIYHLIMEVPGGYWQVVENMDYMPLFEHRRFKCLKSRFGQK